MTIKLLITGGTIDKVYNKLSVLERGRVSLDTSPEILFLKDSLDMNGEDRNLILSKCLECDEDNIVITHGTDTMVETAKLLGNKIQDKTIVLFGAMVPYSIDNSDALFNLGVALNAAQTKDSGVYVAMNGRVFDFDKVEKNKSLGIFTNT